MSRPSSIPISEIFGPTIQGEGPAIGSPAIFVRVGGCDYRCSWCDTMFAVDPANKGAWQMMSPSRIADRVALLARGPILVVFSGGNPALFDGLEVVANILRSQGYQVAIETQGSVPKLWLGNLDLVVISPKGPSSGQPWTPGVQQKLEQVVACAITGGATVALKFVIGSEEDYRFAKRVSGLFPERAIYLQPCDSMPPPIESCSDPSATLGASSLEKADIAAFELLKLGELHRRRYADLVRHTMEDGWLRPVILPRAHVLVWGNERGR